MKTHLHPTGCDGILGHLTLVVYIRPWRNWFAKRFAIVCTCCDSKWGPFHDRHSAHMFDMDRSHSIKEYEFFAKWTDSLHTVFVI